MNEITGKVNTQFNKVDYFFKLRNTNEALVENNERLTNLLNENFEKQDSSSKIVMEDILNDTTGRKRKWQYFSAKVVSNSSIRIQSSRARAGLWVRSKE